MLATGTGLEMPACLNEMRRDGQRLLRIRFSGTMKNMVSVFVLNGSIINGCAAMF